jgi:hypothetical protein
MADASPEQYTLRVYVANMYAELGLQEEAAIAWDQIAAHDFADLPRDANWLIAMRAIVMSCAFVGDAGRAAILYAMLEPFADRWSSAAVCICFGPVNTLLGVLATTTARYDAAERHFQAALSDTARVGARTFFIHAQQEYGSMLLARNHGDDLTRSRQLLVDALAGGDELGMYSLAARIRFDLDRLDRLGRSGR